MPAPDAVLELVERFQLNGDHYRGPGFNEDQTRIEFINPMWKALGWDMDNSQGYAPDYKDVIHTQMMKMGGSSKAPDYSFGIGPTRKFFLEAKRPSVNLEAEKEPAHQLRHYAYTAGLTLSVLTNFRQLAIYDGKIAPALADEPGRAKIKFWTFDQYGEKWDEIAALLSREAILKGAFDRFAASKTKRGVVPFDVAFLREIEGWRQKLAEEIAAKNSISEADLNQSVGRIIDRIIFLRICEENGIEPGLPLLALKNGPNTYPRLVELFRKADDRYNSGLFHFNTANKRHEDADETTTSLVVSNKVIKDILARLYYPETPYAFDYLPLDILGQIYERFLGKVITLKGKKAEIEEKPEVRKAGGVYYTPTYIVSYIVQNTLGRLILDKAPSEIKNLRVLDPACGSGSFLLGAYDFLLKWHLEWYRTHDPELLAKGKNPPIYQATTSDPTANGPLYRLTSRERKRIALDHLFGVDLDAQAVEVTKLSLVLKVLEGETAESIDNALKNHKERALPDLGDNIKCGNSLIGPDFYGPKDPQEWTRRKALSEAERQKLNDFSWKDEFPTVMKAGGFDCVIGNPPYVFTRNQGITDLEKSYFNERFIHQSGQLNTFGLFTEQSHNFLRKDGFLGFIMPNNWLTIESFAPLRKFLLENTGDLLIRNVLDRVFEGASVDTAIAIFKKSKPTILSIGEMIDKADASIYDVETSLIKSPHYIIQIELLRDLESRTVIDKIALASRPMSDFCTVSTGLKAYQIGKGKPAQDETQKSVRIFHSKEQGDPTFGRYLDGANVSRYFLSWSGEYLSYGNWLAEPRKSVPFIGARILVRQIPSKPPYFVHAVFTDEPFYNDINSMVIFSPIKDVSLKFLLGCINSRLMSFWFSKTFDKLQRKIFPQFKVGELSTFPIPKLDLTQTSDKQKHDRMVQLVETMLSLQTDLRGAMGSDKTRLEKRIALADGQIDALVYELYELDVAEIALVEAT